MKTFILIVSVLFISLFSQATAITSAHFDSASQQLHLQVDYSGGLKAHSFHLEWDACQVVQGTKQIAARLIDSGWDDTGSELLSEVLTFDLSQLACKPALLTVRSGKKSQVTLEIY